MKVKIVLVLTALRITPCRHTSIESGSIAPPFLISVRYRGEWTALSSDCFISIYIKRDECQSRSGRYGVETNLVLQDTQLGPSIPRAVAIPTELRESHLSYCKTSWKKNTRTQSRHNLTLVSSILVSSLRQPCRKLARSKMKSILNVLGAHLVTPRFDTHVKQNQWHARKGRQGREMYESSFHLLFRWKFFCQRSFCSH